MRRRDFLKAGLAAGAAAVVAPNAQAERVQEGELDEKTTADLQKMMESGAESSHSITEKYLSRIGQIDKYGPKVNAVIELNPDALEIASKMDAARKAGKVYG